MAIPARNFCSLLYDTLRHGIQFLDVFLTPGEKKKFLCFRFPSVPWKNLRS